MRKIPRVRERTATPDELDDERQRWKRAREDRRVLAPTIRDLRDDLERTQETPAVTMAELVFEDRP